MEFQSFNKICKYLFTLREFLLNIYEMCQEILLLNANLSVL